MEQKKLEQIIKEGKWNSQSDANQYLQKHGLSSQLRDNKAAFGPLYFYGQSWYHNAKRI